MTVGDLRKALEGIEDDCAVVYAHTWRSPLYVCYGSYLNASPANTVILASSPQEAAGNKVLYEDINAAF